MRCRLGGMGKWGGRVGRGLLEGARSLSGCLRSYNSIKSKDRHLSPKLSDTRDARDEDIHMSVS